MQRPCDGGRHRHGKEGKRFVAWMSVGIHFDVWELGIGWHRGDGLKIGTPYEGWVGVGEGDIGSMPRFVVPGVIAIGCGKEMVERASVIVMVGGI